MDAPTHERGRLDADLRFLVQHVDRDREHDRALGRLVGYLEGPSQRLRNVRGVRQLVGPLGHRAGHRHQVPGQVRLLEHGAAIPLADVGHQRRMCAVGVEEHAAGVAEAGPDVQLYESRLARRAGVGVRHADRHALVQAEDELELGVVLQQVHEGLLGGAGVAEEVAMPVGLQLLEQRLLATHARHVVLLTSESSGL